MARQPTGEPTGRPKSIIDWKLFEQLCGIMCTQSEMASMLGVNVDTLRDRTVEQYGEDFSVTYKKYQENGKCSLRRNQFVLSKKNATMAIWLGKQYLEQRDPDHDKREVPPNDGSLVTLIEAIKALKEMGNDVKPKADSII